MANFYIDGVIEAIQLWKLLIGMSTEVIMFNELKGETSKINFINLLTWILK
jgi:hypothetical protein